MPAKALRLPILGLSVLLLSACQNGGDDTKVAAADTSSSADPVLETTVRKAATDAEEGYRYGEAAQHYATLLSKHPDNQDLVLAVARNLRYSGSPQRAIQVVNQSISKLGPKEPFLIELGKDYLASDQLSVAITVLQQARDADPNNWEVLSALGVAQDYQGNYRDAQATYESGLKLSANNPSLLNNYALSLAQSGDLDAAITALQTAIAQPNVTVQTRQNLALMLALKGDKAGASRLVQADLPPDIAKNNISYYEGMNP